MSEPVLVIHGNEEPVHITGRWSDGTGHWPEGDALFDGFDWMTFESLEVIVDGLVFPVYQTLTNHLTPHDTFVVPVTDLVLT